MAKEIKKASFLKRLGAFLIDMIIITILASLISIPFTDTKKVEKIENEQNEIVKQFQEQKITAEEYMDRYVSVYYNLTRNTGAISLITIVLEILYFVVFQLYNKGQTLGKKLLKIKVVSNDGELFMNQMIFRSLLANFILVNIIKFALLLFSPKDIYMSLALILEGIQYVLVFISILMITGSNKDSIHDKLTHTSVVCI